MAKKRKRLIRKTQGRRRKSLPPYCVRATYTGGIDGMREQLIRLVAGVSAGLGMCMLTGDRDHDWYCPSITAAAERASLLRAYLPWLSVTISATAGGRDDGNS